MSIRQEILAGKSVLLLEMKSSIDKTLSQAESKLRTFQLVTQEIGRAMFRGGLLASIPLGFSAREFQNFEDEILFLQTKLQATDETIADLEKTILDLGRTTSFTSTQVAQAATELAKAAFSPQEIKNSLQAVLDLARGGRLSLQESASLIANTLKTFGLHSSQAGDVASKFITAARLGTLEVMDLKESLKEVSGTFRGLNIELPTALALLDVLAFRSLKGTKAGTSLNTALLNVGKNMDKLKDLGIPISDPQGNARKFVDILTDLRDVVKGISPNEFEQLKAIQEIFNIRGGRAVLALLPQLDEFIAKQKEIAASTDEAREAALKMDSKLGGAFRRTLSVIQNIAIEIGRALAPALIDVMNIAREYLNGFNKIIQQHPELVTNFAKIAIATTTAGAGLITMSVAAGTLASTLLGAKLAMGAVFSVLGGVFGMFTSPLKMMTGLGRVAVIFKDIAYYATKIMGGTFAAALTGVSVGFGAGFITASTALGKILTDLEVFQKIWDHTLKSVMAIGREIGKLGQDLKYLPETLRLIGEGIKAGDVEGLGTFITDQVQNSVNIIKDAVQNTWAEIVNFVSPAVEKIMVMWETVRTVGEMVFEALRAIAGFILRVSLEVLNDMLIAIGVWNRELGDPIDQLAAIIPIISEGAVSIAESYRAIIEAIKNTEFKQWAKLIIEDLEDLIRLPVSTFMRALINIVDVLAKALNVVGKTLINLGNLIIDVADLFFKMMQNAGIISGDSELAGWWEQKLSNYIVSVGLGMEAQSRNVEKFRTDMMKLLMDFNTNLTNIVAGAFERINNIEGPEGAKTDSTLDKEKAKIDNLLYAERLRQLQEDSFFEGIASSLSFAMEEIVKETSSKVTKALKEGEGEAYGGIGRMIDSVTGFDRVINQQLLKKGKKDTDYLESIDENINTLVNNKQPFVFK